MLLHRDNYIFIGLTLLNYDFVKLVAILYMVPFLTILIEIQAIILNSSVLLTFNTQLLIYLYIK